MGKPHDSDTQKSILKSALATFEKMTGPEETVHLQFEWSDPERKYRLGPPAPPPISKYLTRHPLQLPKFLSRNIPDSI